MILSGLEIKRRLGTDIIIDPFREEALNPNSYNLRLHSELQVYHNTTISMRKNNTTRTIKIPEQGMLLEPGMLYLGRTMEYTETKGLVPMLEGRSSIGRLGMFVHVTAGFGDVGFKGYWTLEIHCIQPLRIYAGVDVCQIIYHTIEGDFEEYKSGKYQGNSGIQASKLYQDFEGGGQGNG